MLKKISVISFIVLFLSGLILSISCSPVASTPNSIVPISTNSTIDTNGFGWTEYNGKITITNYSGTNNFISIPSEIYGKPVKFIGDRAFISLSDRNPLTINIPNSITSIGEYAFFICYGLSSINLPDTITNIGYGAFMVCTNLTTFTIPSSVITIGTMAFQSCLSLTNFNVENENINYKDIDGVLFSKDDTILYAFPAGKSGTYIIPNTVTNIDVVAFSSCSRLTNISIPNSVSNIAVTFPGCTGLTNISIPNSINSIGTFTFSSCTGLTNINIPSSVTNIGFSAFESCSNLVSVYVDAITPPVLMSQAFDNEAPGRKIYVPSGSVTAYQTAAGWSDYAGDIVSQ